MNLPEKFRETAASVLPVMGLVLALGLFAVPAGAGEPWWLGRFLAGGALLVLGLTIFLIGVDVGIQPLGERCGAALTRRRSLALLLGAAFVVGLVVTAAEPDIQVFGDQVRGVFPAVRKGALTLAIACGVGLFLSLGMLRTTLGVPLKAVLAASYAALFLLSVFAPRAFVGIAFDSGGATTGPMTVPFILALGLGVAAVRAREDAEGGFGLTGIASVGPVAAVLVYAILNANVASSGSSAGGAGERSEPERVCGGGVGDRAAVGEVEAEGGAGAGARGEGEVGAEAGLGEELGLVAGEEGGGGRAGEGGEHVERLVEQAVEAGEGGAGVGDEVRERGEPGGAVLGAPVGSERVAAAQRLAFAGDVDAVAGAGVVEQVAGVVEVVLAEEGRVGAGGALDARGEAEPLAREPHDEVRRSREGVDAQDDGLGPDDRRARDGAAQRALELGRHGAAALRQAAAPPAGSSRAKSASETP